MSVTPKDPQNPSGPSKIHNLNVKVDRDLCIGAGTCAAVASKTFALDEYDKSILIDSAGEDTDQQIIEAAQSCPVLAIIIENEKGERIFPK